MKGRFAGTLFALPFLCVGLWMLWSIATTCLDAWQMRDWVPVDARLTAAGYTTGSGDDADTYEAYARYTYEYRGRPYVGDRAQIASGGDNIGDFQQHLGARLRGAMARGEAVTVWVDPEDPSQSIVDRTVRWGLMAFKSIFVLVFGGIGLGLLIVIWRAPAGNDPSLPEYRQSPWLLNDKWQTAAVRSDAKSAMWGAWLFAAVWSLVSAPLPFLIYREVIDKQNTLALIGLLFPIVGIGLIVWAIRRTREWRRHGITPVRLDPFPGSIGGHVGGTIDARVPFSSTHRFLVTLTCLQSSDKGESRSEKALWQDERVAHMASGTAGTRLSFRFEVPEGLQESDAEQSQGSYHLWRLNVHADLPDTDFDRSFSIPVYATAARSKHVADRDAESAQKAQNALHDAAIRDRVRVRSTGLAKTLVYPMGRNLSANVGGFLVGGIFAAAGWYLIVEEGMRVFGSVFFGTGGLIALAALYMMLKSLEVTLEGQTLVAIRRWLGIPISKREMRQSDFVRFETKSNLQTQSGGKHVMHFKIVGIGRQSKPITLGEGFRGKSEADAGVRFLARELGLREATGANRRTSTKRAAAEADGDEFVSEF